jgi:hypothetical protein
MGQPSTQVSFPAPVILLGRKFGFKRSSNEALADLKTIALLVDWC